MKTRQTLGLLAVLLVAGSVAAQIPKQPATNGVYYKPDKLDESDAFVWDDQASAKRYAIWTIKIRDEAGSLTKPDGSYYGDAAIIAVHIRPKKQLTWLINPREVSSVVNGDLPTQIGKADFGGIGIKGFLKFLSLLQSTPPNPFDNSEPK